MIDHVQLDRRGFIQAGGAATLALLGGGAAAAPARASGAEGAAVDPLRRSGWRALAADGRPLHAGGATLRLDAIAGSEEAFAVTLRGAPNAAPLAQGIHPLAHPLIVDADLFLAPVGAGGEQTYELVVDRSVAAPRRPPAPPPAVARAGTAPAGASGGADTASAGASGGADAASAGAQPAAVAAPQVSSATVAWRCSGLLAAGLRLEPDPALRALRLELTQLGRRLARGSALPLADGSLHAALKQPRGAARPFGAAELTLTAVGAGGERARTTVAVTLR